jgi:hypothetical protein
MADTRRLVELSMVPPLAKEVAAQITGATSTKAQVVALTPLTVTATAGTLPAAGGSVTIANATTPTVAELLDLCMELKAKQDALVAALKA